ncbi:MAG: hypothetical protein NVS2B3_02060 [Vulcanimicrobiaceae bacterium]
MKSRILAIALASAASLLTTAIASADTIGVSNSFNITNTFGTVNSSQSQHENYSGTTNDIQFAASGLQYMAVKSDSNGSRDASSTFAQQHSSCGYYCYYGYGYSYDSLNQQGTSHETNSNHTDSKTLSSNKPEFSFAVSATNVNFNGTKDSSQTFNGIQTSTNTTSTQTAFSNF